ncbi:hypothetical protein ACROYT_G021006 [Oculina patagonica]
MNQAKFFAVLFAMCLVMALVNINGKGVGKGIKGYLLKTKMNKAKFFAVLFAMCLVMALVTNSGNAERVRRRRRERRLTERGRRDWWENLGTKTGKRPNKEERDHGDAGSPWEKQARTGKRPNKENDGFAQKDFNF